MNKILVNQIWINRSYIYFIIKNIPNKKKYYNKFDIVTIEKVSDFGNENLDINKTRKFGMPQRQVDYNIVTH